MKTPLQLPEQFVERNVIRSGPIEREGFDKYAVIFTSSASPSPDDFDPNMLIHSQIENTELKGTSNEDKRFFTIVGGYYMHRVSLNDCRTVKVFGVCLNPAKGFNIVENGSRVLANDWKLVQTTDIPVNHPVNDLNENHNGGDGWTFIVSEVYNERRMYPMSGDPMAMQIIVECPEIRGDILVESEASDTEIQVTCTAEITGPTPESCTWDFGDGSREVTTLPAVTHTYQREAAARAVTIRMEVQGPAGCKAQSSIPLLIPPPPCPEVSSIAVAKEEEPSDVSQSVTFEVVSVGSAPATYVWDFGDGQKDVETDKAIIEHTYSRTPGTIKDYDVRVEVNGPGDCATVRNTTVRIVGPPIGPVPCPDLSDIVIETQMHDETMEVACRVVATGGTPEKYIWSFDDDSEPIETTRTVIKHQYTRPRDEAMQCTIRVKAIGPRNCRGESFTTIEVPAQEIECPKVDGIICREQLSGSSFTIEATASYSGNKPTRYEWDFGDGNTESTQDATAKHTYERAVGKSACRILRVVARGPGECESSAQMAISIPAKCPGAWLSCLLPFIMAIVLIVMLVTGEDQDIQLIGEIVLLVLIVIWIWCSRCFCKDYFPFNKIWR